MRGFRARTGMVAALALGAGCGPSARELKEQTLSTLNVVADSWDGSPKFLPTGQDAYGQPIVASVSQGLLNYDLEVRSFGPDALPKNSDDLVVHRHKPHQEKTLHKAVEQASESVGRGAFRGAIQGVKEGFTRKSVDQK